MKQASAKRTKSQHYVPRLHLKNFVGKSPQGMIWTYDMARAKVRPSTPDNTGAQNNFYSVLGEDGQYVDVLDEWLTDVEGKAVRGYQMLLDGRVPQGQTRMDFSTFVASLYVRSPSLQRMAGEMHGQAVQLLVRARLGTRKRFDRFMDEYEKEKGPVSIPRDELYAFQKDPSRYKIVVDRKRSLSAMKVSDEIQAILFDRRWYVIVAQEDFFITCDSPVYRYAEVKAGRLDDGGFLNPDAHVTLPLSPTHLLLITGQKGLVSGDVAFVPKRTVWEMNSARAIGADNFLYAHVKDGRLSALADQFKDVRNKTVLSGGPYAEVQVVERMRDKPTGN